MILNNYFFPYMFQPFLPNDIDLPPTLYSVMDSIVNFGKDEKSKIKNLAKEARKTIFNFEYPLDSSIDKEKFECMILNHFIMRRINFDTVTLFRIQLDVKLNEIMPLYNKMFEATNNWNLFEDGETVTRELTGNRTTDVSNEEINQGTNNTTNSSKNTSKSDTSNTLSNTSTTVSNTIDDRRYSKLPNNDIQSVKDGKYITDYNFDTRNGDGTDESSSTGSSSNTTNDTSELTTNNATTNNTNSKTNTKDSNVNNELIRRTQADRLNLYNTYQNEIKSIYTMIFNDLDSLFLQIII